MGQRLGQHFLKNQAAIKKIIAALDLKEGEQIIEIGPGRGALTIPLAEICKATGCQILGVEKDPSLAVSVQRLGFSNLEIIHADVLKNLLELTKRYTLNPIPYKIVGNIPYYITGKLLRIIGELEKKPALTVLMIQKEVAERICAQPGEMNLLAAAVQFWAEPKIIMNLKPIDFSPAPKVESAIIRLELGSRKQELGNVSSDKYYRMIKIIFKQPRKTLLNNLEAELKIGKEKLLKILTEIGFNEKSRPQELSLEKIDRLVNKLA